MAHIHHKHHRQHTREGTPPEDRRLTIYIQAFGITLLIAGTEIIGSLLSGSLALIADVTHVLTDAIVVLAPIGVELLRRKTTLDPRHVERIGGFVVAMLLAFVAVHIIGEARDILSGKHDHQVEGGFVVLFALIAALGNLFQHKILSRVSPLHRHTAHAGLHFHVLTDLVKNLLLPVMGLFILVTGSSGADGWAALLIGIIVLFRALLFGAESILGEKVTQQAMHRFIHWIVR